MPPYILHDKCEPVGSFVKFRLMKLLCAAWLARWDR